MRRAWALGALGLAACGGGSSGLTRLPLTSPAFGPGGVIPRQYTCDGRNISPPLHWSDVPSDATQLTLTMVDRDAPGGFIHWQLSAMSPGTTDIGAGQTPAVATVGTNSFGTTGYRGPCPPRGAHPHHYVIKLTALADDRAVASGSLTGVYSRD